MLPEQGTVCASHLQDDFNNENVVGGGQAIAIARKRDFHETPFPVFLVPSDLVPEEEVKMLTWPLSAWCGVVPVSIY